MRTSSGENKAQMLENGGPSLKDISWQSGKPHPGAPKYILQDILTQRLNTVSLLLFFKSLTLKYT